MSTRSTIFGTSTTSQLAQLYPSSLCQMSYDTNIAHSGLDLFATSSIQTTEWISRRIRHTLQAISCISHIGIQIPWRFAYCFTWRLSCMCTSLFCTRDFGHGAIFPWRHQVQPFRKVGRDHSVCARSWWTYQYPWAGPLKLYIPSRANNHTSNLIRISFLLLHTHSPFFHAYTPPTSFNHPLLHPLEKCLLPFLFLISQHSFFFFYPKKLLRYGITLLICFLLYRLFLLHHPWRFLSFRCCKYKNTLIFSLSQPHFFHPSTLWTIYAQTFYDGQSKKKQSKGISNTFYILESCSLNLLDWSCVMCITAAWQHFPIWIRN